MRSLRMQTIPFSNLVYCRPRFEQELGLGTRPEVP